MLAALAYSTLAPNMTFILCRIILLSITCRFCWAVKPTMAEIRNEVDLTPDAPDLSAFLAPIPALGRRLRIAAPCTGIHGCGVALSHVMKVACDSCMIYDLEPAYESLM